MSASSSSSFVCASPSTTFVAFAFPTDVKTEADVLPLLASVRSDLTVEVLHKDPTFALITSAKPAEMAKCCGRLDNGVMLYSAAHLLSEDVGQLPKRMDDAEEAAAATLLQRVRAVLMRLLAKGYVTGASIVGTVQRKGADLLHRTRVVETSSAVTERLKLAEKVGYVKNKLGKVVETVQPVREFATATLDRVADVGLSLVHKTTALPGVSWGVGKVSSWVSAGTTLLTSVTESTVSEFEEAVKQVRLENHTKDVQSALLRTMPSAAGEAAAACQ